MGSVSRTCRRRTGWPGTPLYCAALDYTVHCSGLVVRYPGPGRYRVTVTGRGAGLVRRTVVTARVRVGQHPAIPPGRVTDLAIQVFTVQQPAV